jgi:hypothetical protein
MYSPVATAGGNNCSVGVSLHYAQQALSRCCVIHQDLLSIRNTREVVLAVTPVAESGGMRSSC